MMAGGQKISCGTIINKIKFVMISAESNVVFSLLKYHRASPHIAIKYVPISGELLNKITQPIIMPTDPALNENNSAFFNLSIDTKLKSPKLPN